MVSSKKLLASKSSTNKKASLPQQLQAFLTDAFLSKNLVNPKLLLAFSGGLDSCVLLHLLVHVNKTLPFQLVAQHVHHGLSVNADTWADLCADTCKSLNVPLKITKVQVNNQGLGIEAAARDVRYHALFQADADFILLAHHQDDQAETFLLQLARGAGVKGLAGMAAVSGKLLRPLLEVPRKTLLEYAKQHRLAWVEDESNLETKYNRNFIRYEILPVLAKQYPAIRHTISRSAQHMAEANDLLDEIAALDVQNCLQDKITNSQVLNLLQLQQLSVPRIHNALRWWLTQNHCQLPSTAQLQQITQQLFYAKSDAAVKIKVSSTHSLQRYRNCAFLLIENYLPPAMNLLWHGEEKMRLPNGSHLLFSQAIGQGFALNRVPNIKLRVKSREGGERFRPDSGRPRRSLKSILQTCEIPPWQRAHLPLIFMDETLVMIPNIGADCLVDASFKANVDEMGLVASWQQ